MPVELGVRRRDEHGPRCGDAENGVLQRGQALLVDVLDHLHQHGRVVPGQRRIRVGQRGLPEGDPGLVLEPLVGDVERARGHVDADDLGERRFLLEHAQQRARAAPEVEHAPRTRGPERREHTAVALDGQRLRPVRQLGDQRFGLGRNVVRFGQPLERVRDDRPPPFEVPVGDQLPFRVSGEPALADPQQLVGFVLADPVVLVAVERGQQDVQVPQRVDDALRPGQPEIDVAGIAPPREFGVERDGLGLDLPAQRLEQLVDDLGAAARGQ